MLFHPIFWAYISSVGDVYSCSVFLGDKRFLLGNIYKQSFQEIWEGEKRRENWKLMKNFDASGCRDGCRMDACNRYLYLLKILPNILILFKQSVDNSAFLQIGVLLFLYPYFLWILIVKIRIIL